MSRAWTIAIATALAAVAGPALADDLNPLGDGSGFSNGDLLRGDSAGCENCQDQPTEWNDPPFDFDWRVGLRGAVTQDADGSKVEFLALPEVSLTQNTMRGGYSLGASAELTSDLEGNARVGSLTLDGSADYQVDAVTRAGLKGSFTLSQDNADDPDYAGNVATAPLVVGGEVTGEIGRELGPFQAALRASAGRTVFGETTYDDASTSANDFQNTTVGGLGGRLDYRLTPGVSAFVDGEASYEAYDALSPTLLVSLDNVTYTGRAGLSARMLSVLELEGSLGLAYRDFGDGTLNDFTAVLYDAKATFRPDETLSFTGTLSTSIGSPGTTSGATAKLTYAAIGEAAYQVNPWLRLRGSAGWSEAHYQGIDTDEYKWNVGVGADYLLTQHMDATADYTYSQSTTTPAAAVEEQRLMLGINIHR